MGQIKSNSNIKTSFKKDFKFHFKLINSFQLHNDWVKSVSIFPSGKLISVSSDKTIKIFDLSFKIIQTIEKAHDKNIINVNIKDENNFITCSYNDIKTWIKKNNKYTLNQYIENAHDKWINKVIYCSNGNIISCSRDKTVKIWEINNNKFQLITILEHFNYVMSILLLEKRNLLITSGFEGTKFYKIYQNGMNVFFDFHFNNVICSCWNALDIIDEDRIIIGGDKTLKIISILNKIIIKEINIPFKCWGIRLIDDKGIFLIGGYSKDIRVYRNDNYECIQIIQNAHDKDINGFVELKDGSILTYSNDKRIKIWN
jgi:WD40 repeat protein